MPVPFCINWQSLSVIKPLSAELPIVGGDHEQVAHRAHFRFKNGQFFMASADDREDPIPGALSADATAYHHHGAAVCDL